MGHQDHRRARVPRVIPILVVVGLAALSPGVSAASITPGLACGIGISRSVVLHQDLAGCLGDGLVIEADHITVDLGGHEISGDAITGIDRIDAAIRIAGRHDVTIKNGTLTGFDSGILLDGSSSNNVVGIRISHNSGRGIQMLNGSTGNLIRRNTSSNNGRSGITMVDSGGNTVIGNVTASNGVAGIASLNSNENIIEGNYVARNAEVGINIGLSDRNAARRNVVSGNGDDIIVAGDSNSITGNRISDATGCGDDGCGFGISVEGGTGNLIADNIVSRTRRDGIRVQAFEEFGGIPVLSTVVRGNLTRGAGRDGIDVGADIDGSGTTADTLVLGNTVLSSADDGIDVGSIDTTITANVAVHNGDLGIEAVIGVVDGGRNRAAANGDANQCVGVTCR